MEAITDLIAQLLQNYGITGLAFGGLLALLWKNKNDADKRITELEKQQDENQAQQLANYKEVIGEYVTLVKSNTEVIAKLTSCLDRIGTVIRPKQD